MQKLLYGEVLETIFSRLSETEKELHAVALMIAWSIPGCHQDKKFDVEPL